MLILRRYYKRRFGTNYLASLLPTEWVVKLRLLTVYERSPCGICVTIWCAINLPSGHQCIPLLLPFPNLPDVVSVERRQSALISDRAYPIYFQHEFNNGVQKFLKVTKRSWSNVALKGRHELHKKSQNKFITLRSIIWMT